MTDEEKLLQFRATYEAEIGTFPGNAKEQAGRWFRFLETVPFERHDELVQIVSESWGARPGKPRLREFRQAWRRIKFAEAEEKAPEAACAACDGAGVIVLPVYDLRHNGKHLRYEFGREDVALSEVAFPCRCTKGRNMQYQLGIPDTLCDEAWGMHRDIMKASGHAQIEAGMTKREFFATQDQKACISPNGMKWRMVHDSLQAQREALAKAEAEHKAEKEEKKAQAPKREPEPVAVAVAVEDTSFDFGENAPPEAPKLAGGYTEDELPF